MIWVHAYRELNQNIQKWSRIVSNSFRPKVSYDPIRFGNFISINLESFDCINKAIYSFLVRAITRAYTVYQALAISLLIAQLLIILTSLMYKQGQQITKTPIKHH